MNVITHAHTRQTHVSQLDFIGFLSTFDLDLFVLSEQTELLTSSLSPSSLGVPFVYHFLYLCASSALTLLVGWQEGHPAHKH